MKRQKQLNRESVLLLPLLALQLDDHAVLTQKWPRIVKEACKKLSNIHVLKSELAAWLRGELKSIEWYAAIPLVSEFQGVGVKTNLNFLALEEHKYIDVIYLEALSQKFAEMSARYDMFAEFIPQRASFRHKQPNVRKIRCMYCENKAGKGEKKLTYHHIIPRSIIGALGLKDGNERFNIAVLCKRCHTELEEIIRLMEAYVLRIGSEWRPAAMLADYFIVFARMLLLKKNKRKFLTTTMAELGKLRLKKEFGMLL